MLHLPSRPTVATHWGTYRARMEGQQPIALEPYEGDPDPSPIAGSMLAALNAPSRIRRPAVRASFLEHGPAAGGEGRGRDPFVEVDWPQALDLVARELERVRGESGNGAIYGGSYGWSSAGRFHHAQSQMHRFLNCIGGYTSSVQTYSFGAGETILPYVLGDRRGLASALTTWSALAGSAELIVMFGGAPHKNAQINSGGVGRHVLREGLAACRAGGADLVSISPLRDDTLADFAPRWLAPRPNTDVALMLGLAHTLLVEGRQDADFLQRYTVGFDQLRDYVIGKADGVAKTAEWAAAITEIPAEQIRVLAREMAGRRTFIMMSWSLQRADHGEQPYWMAIALAAMLGGIGRPGEGFGFGYGAVNGSGQAIHSLGWPSLPQGVNPVRDFIPVARIADMLLHPGEPYDFSGECRRYPDVRMIYWAGGNPFHHHQDINRLLRAWRRPQTIVIHESFWNATARHADIVLPVTTPLERNDIACSNRDRFFAASHRISAPAGEARNDFAIFSELAARLNVKQGFTEDRDEEGWIRLLYDKACQSVAKAGMALPDFETFWRDGMVVLPEPGNQPDLLHDFRSDPGAHPLQTPSGRIELYSETIAGFGYDDCPAHPSWLEPREWLGSEKTARFPLHLISNQPSTKLHSQYDHGLLSQEAKIRGREPLRMHPADAAARGVRDGDILRVFNERGACLAGAVLSDAVRQGVVQMATGAWYDPLVPGEVGTLDKHGNPNMLTYDAGTSKLAQATSAHTCLVEVERYDAELPPLSCYEPPPMVAQ